MYRATHVTLRNRIITSVGLVFRKVVYRMYPSRRQEAALLEMLSIHQQIYNAALEQRITAWRLSRTRITYVQQCADLTELRAADETFRRVNAQSEQVTLKRLDLAFAAFLRRCKQGEMPGFPRFRSINRFSGWGYKSHGVGFRFVPGDGSIHGRLRISGIGTIPLRGRARTRGSIRTCELKRKCERWYASFTIGCEPGRPRGSSSIGLDWGVETFATIASEDGSFLRIENARLAEVARAKLTTAQQVLARKARGSKSRMRARRVAALIQRAVANRRRDFLHKESAKLIAESELIATETLSIRNLTRAARGTAESPGRNVAQKAGLNREILATAPRSFLDMLRYKAEEAGVKFVEVPTRIVKPSQTCSRCGRKRKKPLSERQHVCGCGLFLSRDENAARVILSWALAHAGREPIAGCLAHSA